MSVTVEDDFGLAADFIWQLSDRKYDIPEALTIALTPLLDFGIWNLPCRGNPKTLGIVFKNLPAEFIRVAWDRLLAKICNSLEYSLYCKDIYLIVDYEQLEEDGCRESRLYLHKDDCPWKEVYRKAAQARELESVEEVIKSGLVEEFCDLFLTETFAKYIARSHPNLKSIGYWWTESLARFLVPSSTAINLMNHDYWKIIGPIWRIIDGKIAVKWGGDRLTAKMRHNGYHPDGIHCNYRGNYDPSCLICTENKTKEENKVTEADKLINEIKNKFKENPRLYELCPYFPKDEIFKDTFYADIDKWDLSKLEGMLQHIEDWLDLQNRANEEWGTTLPNYGPSPNQFTLPTRQAPQNFIDEVVDIVDKLTKLGVAPDKAIDVTVRILKEIT